MSVFLVLGPDCGGTVWNLCCLVSIRYIGFEFVNDTFIVDVLLVLISFGSVGLFMCVGFGLQTHLYLQRSV